MSFTQRPVPLEVTRDKVVEYVHKTCPEAFLVIQRSKNENVVVMEWDGVAKVEQYWLILEPNARAKRRAKGIRHDREAMNLMENKWAYPYTFNAKAQTVTIHSLKQKPIQLGGGFKRKASVKINGKRCTLWNVFVNHNDAFWTTVYNLDVFGWNQGKTLEKEVVVPS